MKKENYKNNESNSKKIKEIKNGKKLSSKAKRIIGGISATTLAVAIIVTTCNLGRKNNNEKDSSMLTAPQTTTSTPNENINSFDNSTVIIDENNSDLVTSYDPITEEEISQKASKIASIVNGHNMDYTEAFIADIIRILHQIPTNDEQIDVDDLWDFLSNWADKCVINTSNYIGGVEKFKGDAPEIHYADFFDENTIDYAIISEFDSYVNQATHTKDKKEIYEAANGMLKIFYEVIELNGKETKFGLANRNSMSVGGISTLELEIVNTLPILQETDKKIKKLDYTEKKAVVDSNGEKIEHHGYDNETSGGMNIIKLRLNPLSKEEYEIWFSEQFKYVYEIPYKDAKRISATSTDDRDFYKKIKKIANNANTKVEYESQMLNFEKFARFFYDYNQGEIQTAEESDLNQDLRALEDIRQQNCQSKGMAKTLK